MTRLSSDPFWVWLSLFWVWSLFIFGWNIYIPAPNLILKSPQLSPPFLTPMKIPLWLWAEVGTQNIRKGPVLDQGDIAGRTAPHEGTPAPGRAAPVKVPATVRDHWRNSWNNCFWVFFWIVVGMVRSDTKRLSILGIEYWVLLFQISYT